MPLRQPTDDERPALRTTLLVDADLVCNRRWDDAKTWSSGRLAGARAVLGEPGALDDEVALWAATLWGVAAAEADDGAGYPRTRTWLIGAADEWRRPIPWPPCPRPRWQELYDRMIADLTKLDTAVAPQRDFDVWSVMCRATAASTRTCEVCGQPVWQEEIDAHPALRDEHREGR